MIVEESQLKGSRFYENLEPDVSPGYTGKLNAGKYIELTGTKQLTIPIANKALEQGNDILSGITFTGPRCSMSGPVGDEWTLIHDGDHINVDPILFEMNFNISFPIDKLVRLHFRPQIHTTNPAYPGYHTSLRYKEYNSGFGWKPLSISDSGPHGFAVNLKANTNKVSFRVSTDQKYYLTYIASAYNVEYAPTYVLYYDMNLRTHIQERIVYAAKYTFSDINVNNIITMYTKFKSTDIKQLNNEPESILKTLYGGTPVGGNININDLTRYYPVMEDEERVYNVLAKLMGPGFIFSSTFGSSTLKTTITKDTIIYSNNMEILLERAPQDNYPAPVSNVTDNVISDGHVMWTFNHVEDFTKINITDSFLEGPFPDMSEFVNVTELIYAGKLLAGPFKESLLPPNITKIKLGIYKSDNMIGKIDLRNTILKEIGLSYTHFDEEFGLFPKTLVHFKEIGNNRFTSISPEIFNGLTKLESFVTSSIFTNSVPGGYVLPEPSDCILLKSFFLRDSNFQAPFLTMNSNPELEELELTGTGNVLPYPSLTNNIKLMKLTLSCASTTRGSPAGSLMPDYRHLINLEDVAIYGSDAIVGPFPEFNAPNLKTLSVKGGYLSNMSGSFPDASVEFPNLTEFSLSDINDKFIGGVDSLAGCSKLVDIFVSGVQGSTTASVNILDLNSFPDLEIFKFVKLHLGGILPAYIIPAGRPFIFQLINNSFGATGSFPNTNLCSDLLGIEIENVDLTGDIGRMKCVSSPPAYPGMRIINVPKVTGNIPTYAHITATVEVVITECPLITGYTGDGTHPVGNIKTTLRDFSNNGLTQNAIDAMLADYALGTADNSLKLYLDNPLITLPQDPVGTAPHAVGTNAAPSAVGEAAIDTLKARGCTVYVSGTYSPRP